MPLQAEIAHFQITFQILQEACHRNQALLHDQELGLGIVGRMALDQHLFHAPALACNPLLRLQNVTARLFDLLREGLIPMDDIDRYALDIEKIATGAGSASERSSAVDMVIDDLMTDLALADGHVRLDGAPATRTEYLLALRKKLDRLRGVVDVKARPAIDQAVARLH
jgi:hypothetical protein